MRFPIVSDEDGDVSLFYNINEILGCLEPVDIMDGRYMLWDADGYRIEGIVTQCAERPLLGMKCLFWLRVIDQVNASVSFRIKQPIEKDEIGLIARLRRYIVLRDGSPSGDTLAGLLEQAMELTIR